MKSRMFAATSLSRGVAFAALALTAASHVDAEDRFVGAGQTTVVDTTAKLDKLTIAEGARLEAAKGKELTLTVDGVETPIRPGTYTGRVELTPTDQNIVVFAFGPGSVTHHFRQALYVDANGVDRSKSVEAAAGSFHVANGVFDGVSVKSVGEDFNGVYVAGGRQSFNNLSIDFSGNGDDDFAGFGSGFQTTGKDTHVTLDHARIRVHGASRAGITATGGSNLVVKNSSIETRDGVIPADYVPNVDPGKMKAVPWMLGLAGNNRATNVLGENTKATYINSSVWSENWGALSNDISTFATLTAINTKAGNTGHSGYGTYSLGGATNQFYGSELDVKDYGVIVDVGGSTVRFGSSSAATVTKLNSTLGLGLSAAELKSIKPQETVVNAGRFCVFMNVSPVIPEAMASRPPALVEIRDGTRFNAGRAVFLSKGLPANIVVDGSKGAQLNSRTGTLFQVMDEDDPGVHMVDGSMRSDLVYHEPEGAPAKTAGFDVAASTKNDIHVSFTKIVLKGDFYNGYRDGTTGFQKDHKPSGKNLALDFTGSRITGVISASLARHSVDAISAENYYELGNVTNKVAPAINNGVIVSLDRSTWTPTGTSYLTALTIRPGAAIVAPAGSSVLMTVDGHPTPIRAGTYKGNIVISVKRG